MTGLRLGAPRGALAAVFTVALGGTALAQTPPPLFQGWLSALSAQGYTVTQGSAVVSSVSYCQQVVDPIFGTCFLQDPNDPYIATLMPQGAGYVDPYFGQMDSSLLPNGATGGSVFTMTADEAEVVIMNMPPQAAYFGYQGYVFTRSTRYFPNGYENVSPDPARADMFASYTNSINNFDVFKNSGLTWGSGTAAFISTANPNLATALANQFVAAGGSPNLIFTDAVGANVHLGNTTVSDDMLTLIRYLAPANSTASTTWLDNIAQNVFVYRVDPPVSVSLGQFPTQTLYTKSFNFNSTVYSSELTELSTLLKSWLETQESKTAYNIKVSGETETVSTAGVVESGDVGFSCLRTGANCNSDEQDGAHWNVAVGTIPPHHLFILDGVNHAATNNATMMSLAVADASSSTGVLGLTQTNPAATGFAAGTITGSAMEALQDLGLWSQASPQLQADAPNLFVQIFSRGCTATQTYCSYPFTTIVDTTAIPGSDSIVATARAYLLPGAPSGPNPDYLLDLEAIY